MKTAVVYYSKHHGNTKKLLDAIAGAHGDVELIDLTAGNVPDLSSYDVIGFASGIYYSKFHKSLLKFAEEQMPKGKKTFFIYTYGAEKKGYTTAITDAVSRRGAKILGEYGTFGFNTFGPFKLIGGIAKGRPDNDDLSGAVAFYERVVK